ncbi:MAG: cyclic nucleotide-binding domain-containing protein [Planctomycetota bacterium]|nr:cyclic nucleotide-binding domain-containing protein [Planctomycetota bacterium]
MRKVLYILGRLADEDVDWLTVTGARRRLTRGTVLVTEGTPIDEVFLVLDGELAVTSSRTGGRELARLGSGEVVGELSFLDSRPPVATVSVAGEAATVLGIPRGALSTKLEEDAAFAARFYRALGTFLAARLRSTVLELGDARASGAARAEAEDELDPELLDQLELAGARFDWMLGRLRGE